MRLVNFLPLFGAMLAAASGDTAAGPDASPQALVVPTTAAATGPRLSGDSETGLILSWMQRGADGASLHYSRFESGAWSKPETVVEGREMFVNWADMPMVMPMGGERLSAHWLEKSGEFTYAYDVVYVQSADGGTTWSDPIRPHNDGTRTEHGFVSMFADGERTGMIWLDGRKTLTETGNVRSATGMTLRAAFIDPDLEISGEQLVDKLICDCCQTDIAIADSGPVAVYRDRSPEEIRDISVTRYVDGAWQNGVPVANDNWEIYGCPVNGPAIAADGSAVVVTWFTGANNEAIVKAAWSEDSGMSFGEPIEIASGNNLGRVGLALLDESNVIATWLEPGGKVQARTVSSNGELGAVFTVSESAAAFSVPQVAIVENDFIVVWTENDGDIDTIKSARVPLAVL